MASLPDMMASSPSQQSSRFLDLPAEIRVKIYRLLVPEITVKPLCREYCLRWSITLPKSQLTTSPDNEYEQNNSRSFNQGLQILFVSRQIYAEVQPIVDAAPLVLFKLGFDEITDYSNLPPHIASRVSKATFTAWGLLWFRPYLRQNHASSSEPQLLLHAFPNLRQIHIDQFGPNSKLQFPLTPLRFITGWLQDETQLHQDKIIGLLRSFEQAEGGPGSEVKAIDSMVKKYYLTLTMPYTWKIEGYKMNGRDPKIVHDRTEPFSECRLSSMPHAPFTQ